MDRLRQALEARSWLTEIGEAPNMETAGDIRTAAARLVLEGERVWWCEYHKAEMVNQRDQVCWDNPDNNDLHGCHIVQRLLTEVPEEVTGE